MLPRIAAWPALRQVLAGGSGRQRSHTRLRLDRHMDDRTVGFAVARDAVDKGPYLVYPALRGQYSPYLVSRLTNFRMGLPHDTTSDFIMSNVARTLDDDSLQAIAAWLSSLPPKKSL